MQLLRLCTADLRLNAPLAWNVYDASRKLLLCKGYVVTSDTQLETLLERGMYVDQDAYRQWQADDGEQERLTANSFVLLEETHTRLSGLLADIGQHKDFGAHVETLSERIRAVVKRDPDVAISRAMVSQDIKYAVSHKISVALIVQLVGQRLGWTEAEQTQAVCASMTMNVAMLELQSRLYHQQEPLTPAQRQQIESHATRGYETLSEAGVTRIDWLHAVRDHHETRTGLGYPQGRSDSSEMAELLRYADVYCAKVAGRAYRRAKPPNLAARELFLRQQDEPVNGPLIAMIIKEIGMFPPGTFVKLANGETAIVTRRGELANAPYVHSLCDEEGKVYTDPLRRDTKQAEHRILQAIARDNVLIRVPNEKLWGAAE